MKSKTSLFNKAVWKRNVTGYLGLWLGILVAYLLLLPLSLYAKLHTYAVGVSETELEVTRTGQMLYQLFTDGLFAPLSAAVALLAAMFVFSYLFTARASNMMHTFPLNRKSLFCTNYVSGLVCVLAAQTAAIVLALIVGCAHNVPAGKAFLMCAVWLAYAAVETVFFYSMAVCLLMLVGNIVAVPVLFVIANVFYQGCRMIVSTMLTSVCFGIESTDIPRVNVLTPVMYLTRHLDMSQQESGTGLVVNGQGAAVGYLLAGLVFAALAYVAYQKKQVETAGDLITVGWLKPIFRWGVAVCTSALGALAFVSIFNSNSFLMIIISAAVIGVIAFFVAQMLIARTSRVFDKKRVRECLIYTICVCAVYIGLNADVFGMEKKIPALDEISSVYMSADRSVLAQTPEEIEELRAIHSQIISEKKTFEAMDGAETAYYLRLAYSLKDGSMLERYYHVPYEKKDDSVYEKVLACENRPENIMKMYFGAHYPDVTVQDGAFTYNSEDGTYHSKTLSPQDAQLVYEALQEDVAAGRFENTYQADNGYVNLKDTSKYYGTLNLTYYDRQGYVSTSIYERGNDAKVQVAAIELFDNAKSVVAQLEKLGCIN